MDGIIQRNQKGAIQRHRFSRLECKDYSNMKWFMHPLLALIAHEAESKMAKYYRVPEGREPDPVNGTSDFRPLAWVEWSPLLVTHVGHRKSLGRYMEEQF
jgi:hypothetical protein